MTIKKLLLFSFVLSLSFAKAQTPNNKIFLEGFDEKNAIRELRKKGLDPVEFLGIAKREYMIKKAKELGYPKYTAKPKQEIKNNTTSKTNHVHLIPQMSSACVNAGFEQNNLSGWTGGIWILPFPMPFGGNTWLTTPTWTVGTFGNLNDPLDIGGAGYAPSFLPTPNRHVVLTTPPTNNDPTAGPVIGYDSLALNPITGLADIPLISPNGGTSSLRLGNANVGSTSATFPGAETEHVIYSMFVTTGNTEFTYQYAIVLNNPDSSHTRSEQPFFQITVKDQSGNAIGGNCGQYYVATDSAASLGLIEDTGTVYNNFVDVFYKTWTTVTIPLQAYVGTNVTIEFQTADCARTGHFGYAYIDAFCGPLVATVTGFCGGGTSAILTAPPGFSTYQWQGPNNSNPIAGATSQTYTNTTTNVGDTFSVFMVSPSGCPALLKIGIGSSTIVWAPSSTPTCKGGSNGIVNANVIGANSNITYTWTNSGAQVIGNASIVNNLPPGTYSVQVTDITNNCPSRDTVVTVLNTPPLLTTTSSQICGNILSPQLQVPTGALAPYSWTMNTSTSVIGISGTLTYTPAVTTSDYFIVTYKDPSTGCEDSLKTILTPANINFTAAQTNPCNSGNNGSITLTPAGGNPFTHFDWTINPAPTLTINVTPNDSGPALYDSLLAGGIYTVSVNVTGNPTCATVLTLTLVPNTIPTPALETLKGCALDNVSLPTFITTGHTHSWFSGGVPLGNSYPYITTGVTANVVYTDTMRDSHGCVSIYKGTIKLSSFNASISSSEPIQCHGDSTGNIKATASSEVNGPLGNPYTFTWVYPSPFTSSSPATIIKGSTPPQSTQESNLHPGTYTVVIKSGNCIATKTYTLVNPAPFNYDTLNTFYCPKDDSALICVTELGHTQYTWLLNHFPIENYNNDSIWVKTGDVNNYVATYLDHNCKDTAKILITFPSWHALRPDTLVNVFTPNGDNRNDVFYPFYGKAYSQPEIDKQTEYYHIYIYNRWGKLIFETDEYSKPWNGNDQSGTPQDDGTYYFMLKYKSNCSTKADIVNKKGFVQLLR